MSLKHFICICGKHCENYNGLRNHILEKSYKFYCFQCEMGFTRRWNLNRHFKNYHSAQECPSNTEQQPQPPSVAMQHYTLKEIEPYSQRKRKTTTVSSRKNPSSVNQSTIDTYFNSIIEDLLTQENQAPCNSHNLIQEPTQDDDDGKIDFTIEALL